MITWAVFIYALTTCRKNYQQTKRNVSCTTNSLETRGQANPPCLLFTYPSLVGVRVTEVTVALSGPTCRHSNDEQLPRKN